MKTYKTNIPRWTIERGDYNTPTETPETLTEYSLYNRIEKAETPLILFAIGGKPDEGFSHNWDLYISNKGTIYSIPRKGSGACGTYYGDINHIKNLMRRGIFSDTLTPYGESLMKEGRERA